jgi:hypothetical protein
VSEPPKIPFSDWWATPHWIAVAERKKLLTHARAHLLTRLYERANKTTWAVKADNLDHLAKLLPWPYSHDYLSRDLAWLRSKRLIAYETKRGRKLHPYRIRLLHQNSLFDGDQSEQDATYLEGAGPSSEEPASGMVEPDTANGREAWSEQDSDAWSEHGPSTGTPGPSSEQAAKPVLERDPGQPPEQPVRAAQDVLREAKALGRGGPLTTAVGEGPCAREDEENEEIPVDDASVLAAEVAAADDQAELHAIAEADEALFLFEVEARRCGTYEEPA